MYFISIVIGDGTRFMCLYVNFILFHKLFDQHNSSVNQRSLFQCKLYPTQGYCENPIYEIRNLH